MTVRLLQVGVQESSARRFFTENEAPDRADSPGDSGAFQFRPWAEGQAMALLTAMMSGDQHAVKVTIAALYEFIDGDEIPDGEDAILDFYRDHMAELLPFLRQAVHAASSQVWPVKPIMMDIVAATQGEAAARQSG